ncbi:hypothetical protein [Caulobacter hibisci]|uniref:Uncharacterized protein n=1 Tax=Caulobacter hibisci TaxID=2035993 RepID=A0ABS0SS07_9CAUL|nr:hypothetical protein [Caulobacter hibisci]MBI1682343.1 hypothetical protein [Caulobacter hibisci]
MKALRFLAKRRFNYIDAVYLGIVGGQTAVGHYAVAAITFGAGILVSIALEGLDARGDA